MNADIKKCACHFSVLVVTVEIFIANSQISSSMCNFQFIDRISAYHINTHIISQIPFNIFL